MTAPNMTPFEENIFLSLGLWPDAQKAFLFALAKSRKTGRDAVLEAEKFAYEVAKLTSLLGSWFDFSLEVLREQKGIVPPQNVTAELMDFILTRHRFWRYPKVAS